mgnify:CR=1 FL=1
MKKRILAFLTAMLLVLTSLFMTACDKKDGENGDDYENDDDNIGNVNDSLRDDIIAKISKNFKCRDTVKEMLEKFNKDYLIMNNPKFKKKFLYKRNYQFKMEC